MRDINCPIIYVERSKRKIRESQCSPCRSLKWQLTRCKRECEAVTPAQKREQQSSSSKVPFDVLIPRSKKARLENMSTTIHHLRGKVNYYSAKIECLSTTTSQNNDIGQLVNHITDSPDGCEKLKVVFKEADSVSPGLGNKVKETRERDVSDWRQFLENQKNNGKLC